MSTLNLLGALGERLAGTLDPTEVCDWIFTFGPAHVHPETGESMANYYVRLHGTYDDTRRRMRAMFGSKWSHMERGARAPYFEAEYGAVELPEARWPRAAP